ncbi:phosphoadenosine phosphosulfate reductase family protein [Vibrio albus]|uniref:phosphoadenosine phosphosulfate reductase domain-containing protein n=1 Tax=Vibrio albus TaxID=2200953 RepID=UPI001C629F00|nr:phosphoadenosine phosphosulfate reductase family protein [Vibrio albus]
MLSPLIEDDQEVIQWSGVRGDESDKRAGYSRFSEDKRNEHGQLFNFLPIHQWTAADVFACYRYFGVKPNELYKQGMDRVGCMPCILVKKEELAEIAARFPDELDRVARWEKQVGMVSRWIHWMIAGHIDRRQFFEYITDNDGKRKRRPFRLGNSRRYNSGYVLNTEAYKSTCMLGPRGNIIGGSVWDAVDWSKTGRGGQVYDLVTAAIDAEACSSRYGLCE